jgi:hypothetical protein
VSEGEADLRAILETLDPKARKHLRTVLIHDQADRDAIASQLLRYRDQRGDDWADIIDTLTLHPEGAATGGAVTCGGSRAQRVTLCVTVPLS